MMKTNLHNVSAYVLPVFSMLVFSLIVWIGWLLSEIPYDGFVWSSQSGAVKRVDKQGPASGLIQLEDRILAVDGRSVPIRYSVYADKRPGDIVIITIERQGNQLSVPLQLRASSWKIRLPMLVPVLVALGFWIIGNYIYSFQTSSIQSRLFLLVCLISSIALATGTISASGPPLTSKLFAVSLYWLVPLIVSFHLIFPKPQKLASLRLLNSFLFAAAIIISLYQLIDNRIEQGIDYAHTGLYIFHRVWLASGLILVVYLLISVYRSEDSAAARRQIGVVSLGGVTSLLMFLGLTLVPDMLLHKPLFSYNTSFAYLFIIPLSYGYSIVHYQFIPLDRHINRKISSGLTLILVLSILLLFGVVLIRLLPSDLLLHPLMLFAIMLGASAIGVPLERKVHLFVDRLFYGESYDCQTTVKKISQTISDSGSHSELGQLFIQELVQAMQLECACILLFNGAGKSAGDSFVCGDCHARNAGKKGLNGEGPISRCLLNRESPMPVQILRQELENATYSQSDLDLVTCEQARLLMPLHCSTGLLGIIATGPKIGKGEISKDEQEILQVIARQAGIAFEKVNLAAELKQRNLECVRLNQQVLLAGEAERKRLAWELHDQTIQSLTGVGYGLSELRYHLNHEGQPVLTEIQDHVFGIIHDLRQICADLRPSLLDTMGLAAAIRSLIRACNKESAYQVTLEVCGKEEQELPEGVAICIYRSLQETLRNVQSHSDARLVQVRLSLEPCRVSLYVQDDGKGFLIPKNLGLFSTHGHFGLMGIKERVEMLSGTFKIESTAGRGCRVMIDIPLTPL
ncbi:MAG: histidine kinase [Anaerolineales bacterium]|jgi:signal transduction histidine kinase